MLVRVERMLGHLTPIGVARGALFGCNLQGKVVSTRPQAEQKSNFQNIFAGRLRLGGW